MRNPDRTLDDAIVEYLAEAEVDICAEKLRDSE
jgi:hypothetical protein